MHQLTFLKLDGLRGISFAPRHIGDFEVRQFYKFGYHSVPRVGANETPAHFNHLVVYKGNDTDNIQFKLAWAKNQRFRTGDLVIEDVSDSGHLLKTIAFKMRSLVIEKVSSLPHEDEIAFRFERMDVLKFAQSGR